MITFLALTCAPAFGDAKITNSVKSQYDDCKTPLHEAALGHGDLSRLIAEGVDVNVQDCKGRTPLHDAIFIGNMGAIQKLISSGANVHLRDNKSRTPLYDLEFMVGMNKSIKPTMQIEILRLLIENKAEINIQDAYGATPLHYFALDSDPVVIAFLLDNGAKIDVASKNGQTPLHMAARFGNYSVVEVLIKKGADISAKDKKGNTPLMLARKASKNKEEVVGILIKHGAQ